VIKLNTIIGALAVGVIFIIVMLAIIYTIGSGLDKYLEGGDDE